ncbi:MAG: hypothetical protein V2J10_11775 [Wenzhouxiangella sp.]|jgi:hypothetical protein|nr:hypothetical protein [Wenzhouxiangella sp.]
MKFIVTVSTFLLATGALAGEVLEFENTLYGLLFADIEVAGEPVRAMIDFGDPHVLSLSGTFVDAQGLAAEPTGETMMYADGTSFQRLEGRVASAIIGGQHLNSVSFGSAAGEIESVAEQVGTPFDAVVGWGFFGARAFILDYASGRFEFGIDSCPSEAESTAKRQAGHSYLIVDGRIESKTMSFLIDTGHPINVIEQTTIDSNDGSAVTIEHIAGTVDGLELELQLGEWRRAVPFQRTDLSVLRPLGVQAILGQPFLETLKICHDPDSGKVSLYETKGSI